MSDTSRLFGTDGIRGTANLAPMTPATVVRVGQALGHLLRTGALGKASQPFVVIGKDTRLSGYMIEQALSSGLNSMGVGVQLVGPLPTPGIGFLTRNMRAQAGIVISASHNQYQDNGIKIFGPDGFKISEEMEREIEALVRAEDLEAQLPTGSGVGRSKRIDDAAGRYVVYVKSTFPLSCTLDGLRIVLDCANGAAYKVAPLVFTELGAEVILLGDRPSGTNINLKSGALHPEVMMEAVRAYRADVGISLDGDADRVIMCDEKSQLLNGDHILAISAIDLQERGKLRHNTVVTTQMSNFGLDQALAKKGIQLVKTNVGDKYVVEEMRKNQYVLGGEQSGHIIFLEHTTTGDALIAALSVLAVVVQKGKSLSELRHVMEEVPQVLRNVRVKNRKKLDDVKGYVQLVGDINKRLSGKGRTFVRFSGTEPLVRILIEGPDLQQITQYAEDIGRLLEEELG